MTAARPSSQASNRTSNHALALPDHLRRNILVLLAVKAVALTFIWFVFFAPITRPEPGPQSVQSHLLSESDR